MRWLVRALLAAAVLAFGCCSATHSIDFPVYYETARALRHHDFNLYHTELPDHGHSYRYLPVVAVLLVPLTFVGPEVSAFVWFLLKCTAAMCTALMIAKLMAVPPDHRWRPGLWAFLVTGGFLVEEFRGGNAHFLAFSLLVVAFYLLERGKPLAAAFCVSLAISVKITPLLFLAYFVVRRKLRFSALVVLVLLILNTLPIFVFGSATYKSLLIEWGTSVMEKPSEPGDYSLRGVLFHYLSERPAERDANPHVNVLSLDDTSLLMLWALLSLVFAGIFAVIIKRGAETCPLPAYSLFFVAVLALSPHTQRIYFSTLFFPVCVMVAADSHMSNDWRRRIRGALAASFALNTLLPVLIPGRAAARLYQSLCPYSLSALLLFVVLGLLVLRWDRARFEPSQPESPLRTVTT